MISIQRAISIHALVKRATFERFRAVLADFISIHALVKRATVYSHFCMLSDGISIHALVKRATQQLLPAHLLSPDFNPRPREEGDRI